MNSQINELSKGEKANNIPSKYNLRSKKKEGNSDVLDPAPREKNPAKGIANTSKEKKAQNSPPIPKDLVPKAREILNPPSSFNFEHEIQKIKILVPLSELVKHEDFKRSLSKLL
jgi:hypothetical protein